MRSTFCRGHGLRGWSMIHVGFRYLAAQVMPSIAPVTSRRGGGVHRMVSTTNEGLQKGRPWARGISLGVILLVVQSLLYGDGYEWPQWVKQPGRHCAEESHRFFFPSSGGLVRVACSMDRETLTSGGRVVNQVTVHPIPYGKPSRSTQEA